MPSKASAYIGFALKSGKSGVGHYACQTLIQTGRAKVLICSTDASLNTREKFTRLCALQKTKLLFADKEVFQEIGKQDIKLIAVTDINLAKAILQQAEPNSTGGAVIR